MSMANHRSFAIPNPHRSHCPRSSGGDPLSGKCRQCTSGLRESLLDDCLLDTGTRVTIVDPLLAADLHRTWRDLSQLVSGSSSDGVAALRLWQHGPVL